MNPVDEKLLKLIQEVNQDIHSLKLPSFTSTIKIEKIRPIIHPSDLSPLIEHTALKPETTRNDIIRLCDEAKRFNFWGVAVNPVFVKEAKTQLSGTSCLVAVAVGFPLGASLTDTKVEETKKAIEEGANEVDMVIALGALKEKRYELVYQDIRKVVEAAEKEKIPVKVIIEAGLLDEREKIAACLLAAKAGASFVKTSTGFYAKGAAVEDVKLMKEVVDDKLGVKAAGGIRDFETAQAMVEAGAIRLGCSASIDIVTKREGKQKYQKRQKLTK